MPNNSAILTELLAKKAWTTEEQTWFLDYVENNPDQPELETILYANFLQAPAAEDVLSDEHSKYILATIHQKLQLPQTRKRIAPIVRFMRIAAAAIVLVCLAWGTSLLIRKTDQPQTVGTTTSTKENPATMPANQGAVLTLSNGQVLNLDSLPNGTVTTIGGLDVVKKDGQIIYTRKGNSNPDVYNTIATQKGNKYQLVLSDGTIIWLNAASSIKYPVAFSGKERVVEITGEAYFEVAKNPAMPFKAMANGMEVRVLGTHFNVNAYADEQSITTTLLEGSVQIKKGNVSDMLKPGQQAVVGANNIISLVKDADTDAAMAWINNKFIFKNADVATVMRQVMRWYDVEIMYEGAIPSKVFSGDLSKNKSLTILLEIMNESGIHVRLEGKKLFVKP